MFKVLLRVERDGLGMYKSLWWESTGNAHDENHPEPYSCHVLSSWWRWVDKANTRFAFTGERQFLRWVYLPDWRLCMARLGGELVAITIRADTDAFVSNEHQAIYLVDQVLERRAFPLDLFDNPDRADALAELRLYIKQQEGDNHAISQAS